MQIQWDDDKPAQTNGIVWDDEKDLNRVKGEDPSIGGVALDLLKQPLYALRGMNIATRQALGDVLGNEGMQQRAQAEAQEMKYQQQAYSPEFESDTAKGLYSGVQSLARQAPVLAAGIASGGAALPLAFVGADTGGEAYTKYRGRGATPGEASLGAFGEGGVEIATELMPMGTIVKKFGRVGAGKFLAELLAKEIPMEQAATLAQDAIDTAIANPDKTWADYGKERWGAAYQTLLATVAQGGLMAGGSKVAEKYYERKAKKAEEVQTRLDALDKTKEETIKSQGTTTMFVGRDGTASPELGKQITDEPGVVELARARVQDNLATQDPKKFSYWEPAQKEMFDPISGPHYPDQKSAGQLPLDLKTDTGTIPSGEEFVGPKGAKPYEIIPEDPRPRARKEGTEGISNAPSVELIQNNPNYQRWSTADGHKPVLDQTGKPIVLYHGTSGVGRPAIDVFKATGENGDVFRTGGKDGYHFSTKPNGLVRDYANVSPGTKPMPVYGGAIYPVTIRAKNLLTIQPGEKWGHGTTFFENFRNAWKSGKYDAIRYPAQIDGGGDPYVGVDPRGPANEWVYVVKNPNQIKSVTGNSGKFGEVPDIHEATPGKPGFTPEPNEVKAWGERLMEIANNPPDYLNPVERAKWQREQIKLEREFRKEWFNDYAKPIIPDRSIIKPDGTVEVGKLIETIIADPEVQGMRKPLAMLAKTLAPFIMDLKIEVRPEGRVKSGKEDVPGYYSSVTHTMVLGQEGWTARIILHELVHAATSRAINAVIRKSGGYTSKAPEAVKRLDDIMELLRAQSDELADGWYLNGGKIYGLNNLHEFVAEVLTNRYLQNIMREMPAFKGAKSSSNNMFTRFLDAVKDLLGVRKNIPAATLLDQAIDLSGELIEWQGKNAKFINSALQQAWPSQKVAQLNPISPSALLEISNAPSQGTSAQIEKKATSAQTVDADDVKAAVLEDIAGTQYIPKDPVIDEKLINEILTESDGSDLWAITPGALARAIDSGSTLVMTGYRLLDNAAKRTAYLTKQLVAPVEQSIVKLLQNQEKGKMLHQIFMRELQNKNDYTADELRSVGVPDDVIMAHLEFRAMMDQVLERENLARADKGLEPVDRLQSFLTARWSGPWRSNIRDADGKIVWQVAEQSRRGAQRAIDFILSKEPGLKADDLSYKQSLERSDSVEAGYNEMLKLLDPNDPRTKVFEEIYKEYVLGRTEDVAQQEKHFMRKTGVRGYAGDRPWSKEDYKDFFIQQFAYAKNGLKWSEYQTAVDKLKPLISNPKLQELQKNNIAYLKEYSKNHLGFGTMKLFNDIDNFIAKHLGVSPETLQTAMGAAKTYFYLSRLGLSIPFTITQFIQPAITAPAWHTKLSVQGYKHNPVNTAVMGTVNGVGAAFWHYIKILGGNPAFVEELMDPVDKDAVRWMEANGIVEINQLADIKRDLRPQSVKTLAYPFEFTIKFSETVARSMAFMSFVQHLKQSGVFDLTSAKGKAELFQKAEDMTKISMVDYRTTERAMVFERGGLAGDAAATLHSYQFNNLFQLYHFAKQAKEGNPRPFLTMMFMQFLAAGTLGLWFIDDLDDLFENMKRVFLTDEEYAKWNKIGIKSFILENFSDFFAYGLVSKIGGTNIHTRMTAANQIPVWPFEPVNINSVQGFARSVGDMAGAAVPFAGTTGSLIEAGWDQRPWASTPSSEKWESAYAAAPAVAQGPMERLPAFNAGSLSKAPSDLTGGKGRRRTEDEKDLRDLGFRSTEEQRWKDKMWQNTKIETELQRRISRSSEKATKFFLEGNTKSGVKELINYTALGGVPENVLNKLPEAKIKEVTTELERRILDTNSGSYASALKLKRYLDNVGVQ